MENEKSDFLSPGDPILIVKKMTKEVVEEAIQAYAEDEALRKNIERKERLDSHHQQYYQNHNYADYRANQPEFKYFKDFVNLYNPKYDIPEAGDFTPVFLGDIPDN